MQIIIDTQGMIIFDELASSVIYSSSHQPLKTKRPPKADPKETGLIDAIKNK